ncbi:MAG: recombinase family protein [Flavobacteriales bacterium]|nr:recombinase family protein [Flavobacteriales bacterium]MCB9448520.1 recombinase family protein [Flavobacteriales bacterium]
MDRKKTVNDCKPDARLDSELLGRFAKGSRSAAVRSNNCVIYTRVSSKEQAENNMSLDTQRKACEQFAMRSQYTIMGYFGGTYESAKTDERQEFNRMLHFVKKSREKIAWIIVYSVDRFSRSGANAIYLKEQLKKQGILILAVTQPTDATTASGSLQQNIQFIFSEYDNELRREKCMAGVKEALLRGEWCNAIPTGYDRVTVNGQRKIVVNDQGKLLRKAFLWKANQGISNEEARGRLAAMGLKLSHQRISSIFRNPFYCGWMAHNALEGKLVEGNHEKLISKEVFLKVNNIQNLNPHGYKHKNENDHIPLKIFLQCDHCGTSMVGYIVRKKKIWYYKCRKKGCANNKSAKALHLTFENILSSLTLDPKHAPLLREQMIRTYTRLNRENEEATALLQRQLDEIEGRMERLEERYVTEEITQELFVKYREKFSRERVQIVRRLQQPDIGSSNLEIYVDAALHFAENLRQVWVSGTFAEKQRLQYLLFPQGLRYRS